MGRILVGCSGWQYASWREALYPKGCPQREWLTVYASRFPTVEVNSTFYRLPRREPVAHWVEQVPEDFVFAVKVSRYLTHIKRLTTVREGMERLLERIEPLITAGRLGPLLWQLPPRLRFDAERIDEFLTLLPRSTGAAAQLAGEHDERLDGRAETTTDADRPLRHALEVRHESFRDPAFVALLREHDVALVVADTAGKFPYLEDVTAGFVYVRLHGDTELYVSGYAPDALDRWGARVRAWLAGESPVENPVAPTAAPTPRDVYVYFDNDVKVAAPFDAIALAERVD